MSLMGLDVGTTGCKAVVVDPEGRILSSAYREYALTHPRPGWVELDSDLVWAKTREAISEATSQCRQDLVKALAISSMGEAVTPISGGGRALCPSILGFDIRGQKQAELLAESPGPEWVFENTGMPLSGAYTLPKLMWWKDNMPTTFAKAKWFLCYQDLIAMRLGAEPAIDWSLAGRTLGLDIHRKEWQTTLLERAEVDPVKLSRPVASGTVIGEVRTSLAEELGLGPNCRLVAGGHDQPAGCLGAGCVAPGLAMDATGTVECIGVSFSSPVLNEGMRTRGFCCYHHVVPGLYLTLAFNWTGGSLLRWFRDELAGEDRIEAQRSGRNVYDLLLSQARPTPTDLLVLPYFTMSGTPHFDEQARGAILGLSLATRKGDLIKALLEGISLEMKLNMAYLEEAGVSVGSLRAIGGGARSPIWLQLKADIFNRPVVTVDATEAACLGMAIMAGVGYGTFKDPVEGAQKMIHVTGEYSPDERRAAFYSERLKVYEKVYPTTRSLMTELEPFRGNGT